MSQRCTGHCCLAFTVVGGGRAYGPDEIEELRSAAQDGEVIADMLIPLLGPWPETWAPMFTCRHFDGMDCTIQETKPAMCRDYGKRYRCKQADCTMTEDPIVELRVTAGRKRTMSAPPEDAS